MEQTPPGTAADEGLLADLRARYIPDAIVLLRDGVVSWVSPNAMEMLGWSPDRTVGLPLDALVHDDDRQVVASATAAAASGRSGGLVARAGGGMAPPRTLEVLIRPREAADGLGDVVVTLRPIDNTVAFREVATADATAPRALADRAGDIFFVFDGTGTVLEVGAALQEKLGWLPEEFMGSRCNDWVYPDDLPALEAYRTEVQTGNARGSIEMRVRARGGGLRWMRVTGVMVQNGGPGDPEATRILVSWRDIDSLVREKGFAEREVARLRAFMDVALDPWLILTPMRNAAGVIDEFLVADANEGAAEYLRWPRDRLVGAHLLEEFPDLGAQGLMQAYVQCAESGEPVEIHDLAFPHDLFGESRFHHLRGRRVNGQIMLKWHDTTVASTARNELATNEALFRGIANHAGDAVVMVEGGEVTWASSGAVELGLPVGSAVEPVLLSLVVPDSQAQVHTCCLLLESAHAYRGRWHRPDGPPLIVCANPVPGESLRGLLTFVDETWTLRDPQEGTTGFPEDADS